MGGGGENFHAGGKIYFYTRNRTPASEVGGKSVTTLPPWPLEKAQCLIRWAMNTWQIVHTNFCQMYPAKLYIQIGFTITQDIFHITGQLVEYYRFNEIAYRKH